METLELMNGAHRPCDQCDWEEGQIKSEKSVTMHKIRKHGKGWSTGQNFVKRKGLRWTPKQRKKFIATMAEKRREKEEATLARRAKRAMKRIPVTAQRVLDRIELRKEVREELVSDVVFCPRCGCNIRAVSMAIALGDRQ